MMSVSDRLYGLIDRLRIVQLWLAAAALTVMMCVTVADVTLRYALNRPIRGSYDLVEVMMVLFVFHGLSTAFLFRRHIAIDLMDLVLAPSAVGVFARVADLLSVVALAVIAYAMIGPTLLAYDYGDLKLELHLPIYVLWFVALAGMVGAILCALGALLVREPRRAGVAPQ